MRPLRYRLALAATCAATLTIGGAGAALAAQSRIPITGTGYQTGYGLVDDGPSDPNIAVTDNIYLGVRDPAALAAQARAISTPGSPEYGKYRSPQQIQAQNQLTSSQLDQVRNWLTSAGLTVTEPDWRTLRVTGTIGQLDTAFGVTFDSYTDPDTADPYRWQIPTTDLTVPAGIFPLIFSPSTDTFPVPITSQGRDLSSAANHGTGVNRPAKLGGVSYPNTASEPSSSCTQYWGQSPATGMPEVNGRPPTLPPCGYTPGQLKSAYGLNKSTLTGQGQTVAVVTPAMDTLEQDVNTWSSHVGVPGLHPGQLTVVPTPDGSTPPTPQEGGGGMVENTLDVESVHGMAPDANIESIGLSNANYGSVLDSLIYILDHTKASIVSLSLAFSNPPGLQQAYESVYQEGAVQGVGFYYSSGDGGHDPATGSYLNPQAGSDWATGVGGTSLGVGPAVRASGRPAGATRPAN